MFMCYDTYHHWSGIGQLHLVVLLHVTHSSDVPRSPPMHNDLPPLPGQLLASSKLLPCCTQYLQRLLWCTFPIPASFPCRHFFPSSPLVGGAPPTIVPPTTTPSTGCSINVPCGCGIVGGSNTVTVLVSVAAAEVIPNPAFISRSLASLGAALATASRTLWFCCHFV